MFLTFLPLLVNKVVSVVNRKIEFLGGFTVTDRTVGLMNFILFTLTG